MGCARWIWPKSWASRRSYLNLIEHDQRPLTAALLLKLAELYPEELKSFGSDGEARLVSDLHEVFGDPLFEAHDVTTTDLRETAANESVSRAIVKLYHAYRDSLEAMQGIASRVSDGGDLLGPRSGAAPFRRGLGRPAGEPELLSRARGRGRAAVRGSRPRAARPVFRARPVPRRNGHLGRPSSATRARRVRCAGMTPRSAASTSPRRFLRMPETSRSPTRSACSASATSSSGSWRARA